MPPFPPPPIYSVCSFVFAHSPNVASAPSGGNARTMEGVLPLLKLWLARAQAPVKLKVSAPLLKGRGGRSHDACQDTLKALHLHESVWVDFFFSRRARTISQFVQDFQQELTRVLETRAGKSQVRRKNGDPPAPFM